MESNVTVLLSRIPPLKSMQTGTIAYIGEEEVEGGMTSVD